MEFGLDNLKLVKLLLATNSPVVCYQCLAQSQLSEHVHYRLHWRLICNCDRCHIQDLFQLQRLGSQILNRLG